MNLEKERKLCQDQLGLIERIEANMADIDAHGFNVTFSISNNRITFHDIKELHAARALANQMYPGYRATFKHAFASCGSAIATYGDINFPVLNLWLETSQDNFPKSLLGEDCAFVEVKYTDTQLVCNL